MNYYNVWRNILHIKPESEEQKEALAEMKKIIEAQMDGSGWHYPDKGDYTPIFRKVIAVLKDGRAVSGIFNATGFAPEFGGGAIDDSDIERWKEIEKL